MPDQRSLTDQLNELDRLAGANGLYDAQDWLRATRPNPTCRHWWSWPSANTVIGGQPPTGTPCGSCGVRFDPTEHSGSREDLS